MATKGHGGFGHRIGGIHAGDAEGWVNFRKSPGVYDKTIKAYFFRLDLDQFWTYSVLENSVAFLDDWCRRVMRSRIKPMMTMAKSFRVHRPLKLNYFRASKAFSSSVVEGLNNKAKAACGAHTETAATLCLK